MIRKAYPPNYDQIVKRFPQVKLKPSIIFTYAPDIYCPSGNPLDLALEHHEETHIRQQGNDPAGWWERYLTDNQFRLEQELEAYRAQWKTAQIYNRDSRKSLLNHIAKDLSGPMYGHVVTKKEALALIKNS